MSWILRTIAILATLAGVLMSPAGWGRADVVAHFADRAYTSPTEPPIVDPVIVVQGGKFVAVGMKGSVKIPAGATVHEHKGATIVPGFWNSHVHFMEPDFASAANTPAATLTSRLREMLLRYGFVRVYQVAALDLKATHILRERIRSGAVMGPDILTTGEPFVAPGGTPGYIGGMEFPSLADASAAREAVREQVANGVDGIKLMPQTFNPGGHHTMSVEAARAAVDEAHASHKLAFAHPTNNRGLGISLQAGVDVIVHTSPDEFETWDEPLVTDMKRAGVALIPTLKLYRWDPARQGASAEIVRRVSAAAVQQLSIYARHGGVVLFGTDVGYMTDYDPSDEYQLMAEAGLTFEQLLASLTTAPARKFGLGDRTGELKRGMDADMVILEGDPKQDLAALTRVKTAYLRGQAVYKAQPGSVVGDQGTLPTSSGPLAGSTHLDETFDGFVAREYRRGTGVKLPYRLYVPVAAERDQALPLILYLHGSGGAGTDNQKQISGGNTLGTHVWTEPAMQERHPAFVLAPQIPEDSKWHSSTEQPSPHVAAVFELLDELRSELRIDPSRVYVVGQSLGGFGVWDVVSRRPDVFAAAVPLCGGGDTKRILSARDVAVWAFHGATDATVPVSRSREMVSALRTVNSSVRYTEYPDVGHDVWGRAFGERDLPEWMFGQRRR